ncbi:MAG: phosphotransferase [Saprospiraceae bacterium]|nr:phosphotransferase [Saprospiraceae bacterium]
MKRYDLDGPVADFHDLLKRAGVLSGDRQVSRVDLAGQGNMNVVLRVWDDAGKSWIVKQSRPYVNKYPTIPAPLERILVEASFYQAISSHKVLQDRVPNLIFMDQNEYLMVLEDLGPVKDFTTLYKRDQVLQKPDAEALIDFLIDLHSLATRDHHPKFPSNLSLRKLNHEHLFLFPYQQDNGLDLDDITPGLAAVAAHLRGNKGLQKAAQRLGERYLGTGTTLLHGDFYPGSWMKTEKGLRILDPEFSFMGPAAYDLGVMLAHLLMAGDTPDSILTLMDRYVEHCPIDRSLVMQFVSMEIIRRLIGLAQLPLDLRLDEKESLLSFASDYLT